VDVLAIDVHAFDGEARDVVDRDVLQLGVLGPVFVEDEEDLLRSSEGEDGEQNATAALQDRLYKVCGRRVWSARRVKVESADAPGETHS
jgi:hypothetical protein